MRRRGLRGSRSRWRWPRGGLAELRAPHAAAKRKGRTLTASWRTPEESSVGRRPAAGSRGRRGVESLPTGGLCGGAGPPALGPTSGGPPNQAASK